MKKKYVVRKTGSKPLLSGGWENGEWQKADILEISIFREQSSSHHPVTKLKMLYNEKGVYGLFKVDDQYVRALCTGYQESVCKDSCVEFFVKPKTDKGYINFEFNCGGAVLSSYITDHRRTEDGFGHCEMLKDSELDMIEIYHSMPETVDPEITEPTEWFLGFFIPFALFEKYVGEIDNISGTSWSANFYKCADDTSHPHWASWSPITETNFHLPECFGEVEFDAFL